MYLHLFTTDVSALRLLPFLDPEDQVTCVIVPGNRIGSDKVRDLIEACDMPIREHRRGRRLDADLPEASAAVSWLYSQVIRPEDLARYPEGLINMHGGVLPDYRGANVLQWAMINGERELGVTWHEIVEAVDAGPIWAESRIPIPDEATATEMRAAMIDEGLRLFPEAWRRFWDKGPPVRVPDLSEGRVWPPRKPEDGRIHPHWPGRRVRDMVRALSPPWPAATVRHRGRWVAVGSVARGPAEGAVPYETAEGAVLYLLPRQ